MVSEGEARKLAKEFVKELEEEFNIKLLSWLIGSVPDGNYVAGKSDIDIVIIPDEGCDYGKIAMRMLKKRDESKYLKIQKKGRMTNIIDPVVFFDVKMIMKLRKEYHKRVKK